MRDAAEAAASGIRGRAGMLHTLTVEAKSPMDFVSEVDRDAEALLRERLLEAFPQAAFVGEESAADGRVRGDAPLTFVVDPLDGTANFLHGYPEYAVSIAALVGGRTTAGVVRNVPTGETFWALLGDGAFRDGARIRVSTTARADRALIGTGIPFKDPSHFPIYMPQLERVARSVAGVRRAGAAALDLCDVACGRLDAFWELELQPWDMAAGALVIREAGGRTTDLEGREAPVAVGPLAAGNPAMHAWLLQRLTSSESPT